MRIQWVCADFNQIKYDNKRNLWEKKFIETGQSNRGQIYLKKFRVKEKKEQNTKDIAEKYISES